MSTKKKISHPVSREAAFDYSKPGEMKGFICGNWDIRYHLPRETKFFFKKKKHPQHLCIPPKINKILGNTLILCVIGDLLKPGGHFYLLDVVCFELLKCPRSH